MDKSRVTAALEWAVAVAIIAALVFAGIKRIAGGSVLVWLVGVPIALLILGSILAYIGVAIWGFTVELYRGMRYDRHGICYRCKRPFAEWCAKPVDQMYGPSEVVQGVCECGNASLVRGNRRFADW